MLTRKDFTGLRVVVRAHQKDGQAILNLADRFSEYVRKQFYGAEVVRDHGESISVDIEGLPDKECRQIKARLCLQAHAYRYLDKLIWIAADIDAKFKIENRLIEEICKNYDGLKFATTFFRSIDESLSLDVVISLCRVFERKSFRKDTYNLHDFLEFVKRHCDELPQYPVPFKGGQPVTLNDLDAHLKLLDEFDGEGTAKMTKQLVAKLMHYRDKIAAHHDKDYFFDLSNYPEEMMLMRKDIERLIEVLKTILKQYWLAFLGASIDIDFPTANDFNNVLQRLAAYKKIIDAGQPEARGAA